MSAGGDSGRFGRFRALSFDCYGTLIDWEKGIVTELSAFAARHGRAASADELLDRFATAETVVQAEDPGARYPAVLAESLRRIGAGWDVLVGDDEADEFGASVARWPAFPDSREALARLKQHFRLIILSNVDHDSFEASRQHLAVAFDLVLTAQDIGSYKPDLRNFEALLAHLPALGVEREQLLHVAQSLYHDHEPAQALGIPTVWIDRRHDQASFGATPPPRGPVQPDWRFETLAAFADAATA
jgi:2-haloalkanoic acid dehalogenase type II